MCKFRGNTQSCSRSKNKNGNTSHLRTNYNWNRENAARVTKIENIEWDPELQGSSSDLQQFSSIFNVEPASTYPSLHEGPRFRPALKHPLLYVWWPSWSMTYFWKTSKIGLTMQGKKSCNQDSENVWQLYTEANYYIEALDLQQPSKVPVPFPTQDGQY